MATQIWANIGSSNGLLPDGTKPLPEPTLTYGLITKGILWHSPESSFTSAHELTSCVQRLPTLLQLLPCLPGANELSNFFCRTFFRLISMPFLLPDFPAMKRSDRGTILGRPGDNLANCMSTACRLGLYDNSRPDTGLTLGLCPANERRRYKVTPPLIGWAQT